MMVLLVAGCSGDDGPPRYRLTGAITYEGQPVPRGWIAKSAMSVPIESAGI